MKQAAQAREVDVLVVGAGVAGLSAATAAAWSGKSVVLIEKSDTIGGTAAIANGSIWIPNNDPAIANGFTCDLESQVRFILSECWDGFDESQKWCGVSKETFLRVDRYVKSGLRVARDLTNTRVQTFTQLDKIFKRYFFSTKDSVDSVRQALGPNHSRSDDELAKAACSSWDYHWENKFNKVPYGKHIWAAFDLRLAGKFFFSGFRKHLWHIVQNMVSIRSLSSLADQIPNLFTKFWGFGSGLILVERFRKHLDRQKVPILKRHELVAVATNGDRVTSVDVQTADRQTLTWKIRDALIIASGCFSHQLTGDGVQDSYSVKSSCVAPGNDGDAIRILKNADVQVNQNPRPVLAQTVIQLAKEKNAISHEPVFYFYGDSFFLVDRHGRRVMNEKLTYHDRAQHHVGNAEQEFLFLVCDRRFKERYWGLGIAVPFDQKHMIVGNNESTLHEEIDRELRDNDCDFRLADNFSANLRETKIAFNEFARTGDDREFGRGKNAFDVLGYMKPDRDHDAPSRSMQPLAGEELYACIYGLSTFGTHGGLVCDEDSRVLNSAGDPWNNLYAVGTCAASFLNGHYPSHGMSIGTGMVFGYLAGLHATSNTKRL
ncbi:FAD-dependent oxidoreductase [Mariniblastus fucicola]|uniref:3-oxosteroid 1-dehydrogenase n=1 Tax=Mariniblastus fucicola TaxID=980251 RepID=A0A5B9PNJ7_9BACT|nr:FAD-dependent oxidoreductase [Mariniblastus fucicola]QEG23833.1 3-oxosteroid 1-dehydrogenase [Mariniblastus fucicola]